MSAGQWLRVRLRSESNRHLSVVFLGHLARLAIGLISSALLARGLGPEGLSLFSVLGAASAIALTVSDFGLSSSAVSLIASGTRGSDEAGLSAARSYSLLKVAGSLLVVGALLLGAAPAARLLGITHPDGPLLIRVASLGLLATNLSGQVSTVLRALDRFRVLVLTQLANIVLTVLMLGALFLAGRLTVLNALGVGALTALAAALLGASALPAAWRHTLLRGWAWDDSTRHLLGFSKWLAISGLLTILLAQLELLLLNHWRPAAEVAFYALALNLAFKAHIVNQTLHTVLLPEAARLSGRAEMRAFVRRNLRRGALLALGMLALLPLARPFIVIVYSNLYAPSVGLFYALMGVILFDLLTLPPLLLAFPLKIPHMIMVANAVGILVLLLGCALLIPLWGLYGAAAAKLLATLANTLVLGGAIAAKLRRVG